MQRFVLPGGLAAALLVSSLGVLKAQDGDPAVRANPPATRPGGFGGGFGGFGGPMGGQQERKIVDQFDQDKNGWLNKEERAAARAFILKERANAPQGRRGGGGGGGGGGGFGGGGGGGGFGGGPQGAPGTRPTTAPGNIRGGEGGPG